MKKIEKYFFPAITFFLLISCAWGAGSYAYAEVYLLNLSSAEELIDNIKAIKQKDNSLNIYYTNENGDTISMDGESYSFYMNYYLIDSIGYMCAININQKEEKMVAMQFVAIAIGEGIDKNDWKEINTKELSCKDNEKYKKLFEKNILNRLSIQWRKHQLSDYFNN